MAHLPFLPSGESRDLSENIRALFEDLAATLPADQQAHSGECMPALDVRETDEALEVVLDVSGVPLEALRVLFRDDVLIVAGEKAPRAVPEAQNFHLVEREFGRFARAVRLSGAFDVTRGVASLRDGELSIVLPKITDRRGRSHRIAIHRAPSA